jgi:hypothetical protein
VDLIQLIANNQLLFYKTAKGLYNNNYYYIIRRKIAYILLSVRHYGRYFISKPRNSKGYVVKYMYIIVEEMAAKK